MKTILITAYSLWLINIAILEENDQLSIAPENMSLLKDAEYDKHNKATLSLPKKYNIIYEHDFVSKVELI